MSASELPTEILQDIFRRLTGYAVVQCRAVCSRWRDSVDALSDAKWHQICYNDCSLRRHYAKLKARHGLSWYNTFRAFHSWSQIASAELTTHVICDDTEFFIVRPHGIVGCFKRTKESDDMDVVSLGMCDTIVYYDTATGEECDRQQHDFYFRPRLFDENAYLQVFVLKDYRVCILVKETKQKYFVGSLEVLCEMALIGKSVYFKNGTDQIIYQSKLNDDNTFSTKKLGAFDENHENFEDIIITFIKRGGNLYFLTCKEFSCRANTYQYKDEDFECLGDMICSCDYFFGLLEDEGFDWKSPAIFNWIRETSKLTPKCCAFYANQMIILSASIKEKAINIHSYPNFIPGLAVLKKYLKTKPLRKIVLGNDMIKSIAGYDMLRYFDHFDVIETPLSHKVLAKMNKTLFVFDLKPNGDNKTETNDECVETTEEPLNKNTRKPRVTKRKTVLARKKGVKRALK